MKRIAFSLILILMVASCNGQDANRNSKKDLAQVQKSTDSLNPKPKVQWKVNKKYDENGNVIGYDSIYSWSYSNHGNIPPEMDLDSIMRSFRSFSNENFPSFWDDGNLDRIFPMDSIMNQNFSMEQFFNSENLKGFPNMDMDQWIRQMDSLRNKVMEKNNGKMMELQNKIHHKSESI